MQSKKSKTDNYAVESSTEDVKATAVSDEGKYTQQYKTAPLIAGVPELPEVETTFQDPETNEDIADPVPAADIDIAGVADNNNTGTLTDERANEPAEIAEPDPEIDSVVDDNVPHDGIEPPRTEEIDHDVSKAPVRQSVGTRVAAGMSRFFGTWWHNRIARYATVAFIFLSLVGVVALPTGRYFVLNTAGIQTAASLTIIDNSTQLPLKNVTVSLGDTKARTNDEGIAKLDKLKLGTQALEIRQIGFAPVNKTLTLGWGSNPLGDFTLDAVGLQARYKLIDFLSGKPITNADVSSGDTYAQADNKGLVVLALGELNGTTADITFTADGYRTERQKLDVAKDITGQPIIIPLVSEQPEVFISKQNGKYDLFKIDLDGKNREVLLGASELEDADITVAQKPNGKQVALVSKRDKTRNQDGFQLQALTVVDTATGNSLNLDHSERIQIVDWLKDRLIYIKVKAGTSAGNAERYQLISYDFETNTRLQLATANYFNDVVSVKGNLYVAASNNYSGGTSQFFKIGPDNTGRQILLDKTDVWNISRVSYNTLTISSGTGTYEYIVGEPGSRKTSDSTKSGPETRFYLDAAGGKHSLWTEKRDGKGVLLVHNIETGKDTVLATKNGLSYPVRWLGDRTIVYRVVSPGETADYVVSLDGGTPRKIVDLTNTAGIGRLNYR